MVSRGRFLLYLPQFVSDHGSKMVPVAAVVGEVVGGVVGGPVGVAVGMPLGS